VEEEMVETSPIEIGVNADPGLAKGPVRHLGKEDFLRLLVTQLEYQDPLNPMQNTEFIAQMAQFSTLEGINNLGSDLGEIRGYMQLLNNFNAIRLIGQDIKAVGNTLTLPENGSAEISYYLHGDAAKVIITIYDQKGRAIRTIEESNRAAGNNTLLWDGRTASGELAPPGQYYYTITATGRDGNRVRVDTFLSGRVDGVVYEEGIPYLLVNNTKVGLKDVLEV